MEPIAVLYSLNISYFVLITALRIKNTFFAKKCFFIYIKSAIIDKWINLRLNYNKTTMEAWRMHDDIDIHDKRNANYIFRSC